MTTVEDEIRPLRVILFGQQFCALDDAELMGISASGPNCLQTMAQRLLQSGYAPQQTLSLHRGAAHRPRLAGCCREQPRHGETRVSEENSVSEMLSFRFKMSVNGRQRRPSYLSTGQMIGPNMAATRKALAGHG